MENRVHTSLGVLIGGVHTYFPKEIIGEFQRGRKRTYKYLLLPGDADKGFFEAGTRRTQ